MRSKEVGNEDDDLEMALHKLKEEEKEESKFI
jgi:hypothetical protein